MLFMLTPHLMLMIVLTLVHKPDWCLQVAITQQPVAVQMALAAQIADAHKTFSHL